MVIIPAMLYRLSLAVEWLILTAVCLMVLTYSAPRATNEEDRVRAYTRNIEFDYVSWMLNAAQLKIQQGAVGMPGYLDRESSTVVVMDYLHTTQLVIQTEDALNKIFADPTITDKETASAHIRAELDKLTKQQAALAPIARPAHPDCLVSFDTGAERLDRFAARSYRTDREYFGIARPHHRSTICSGRPYR